MFLLLPRSSRDSARVSPFLKQTASLGYNSVTKLYSLSGKDCQHSGDHLARNCVALEALGLRWCPELQSVIDTTQKSIVTARCLASFLKRITSGTLVDAECLLHHLRDIYHIDISESDEDLKLRLKCLLLTKSISLLDGPVLRYKCSLCFEWFPRISQHCHHVKIGRFRTHPVGKIEIALKRYFILPLKSGTGATMALQKSLKVMLAPDFTFPADSNPEPLRGHPLETHHDESPLTQLTIPAYVDNLGWSDQLEKAQESPLTFLEIKDLASGHRTSKKERCYHAKGSPSLLVEEFLFSLPHFVREYLNGAERRISSAHCSVRRFVTVG
jgi:hypothetical protein